MTNLVRYYILVTEENNWKKSFEKNVWGFSEKTRGYWNSMEVGEYVAFYVTEPIKKIIGFGKVVKKYVEEDLFWPDEILFNRSLLKYRIKFDIVYRLDDYTNGIKLPLALVLNVGRKVISEEKFLELVRISDTAWNSNIEKIITMKN